MGGLAVAVPLELKGLWKAQQLYGRAQWASLVAPAAALARDGFPAHPYLIDALNKTSAKCACMALCCSCARNHTLYHSASARLTHTSTIGMPWSM